MSPSGSNITGGRHMDIRGDVPILPRLHTRIPAPPPRPSHVVGGRYFLASGIYCLAYLIPLSEFCFLPLKTFSDHKSITIVC